MDFVNGCFVSFNLSSQFWMFSWFEKNDRKTNFSHKLYEFQECQTASAACGSVFGLQNVSKSHWTLKTVKRIYLRRTLGSTLFYKVFFSTLPREEGWGGYKIDINFFIEFKLLWKFPLKDREGSGCILGENSTDNPSNLFLQIFVNFLTVIE